MNLRNIYDYGTTPIHVTSASLCAVLLGMGWVLGFGPLMSQSTQSMSVIEQAEEAEFEAKKVKGELHRLSQQLESVEQQLDEQPVSLLSATQINPMLVDLAGWSEAYRLTVTRTEAGRRQALLYYDYVPIEVAGEGSFSDLMGFLKHMHTNRGDIGVTGFVIKRQASGLGVSFEIDLAWYVLSDDVEVAPENGPQPTASVPTN